MMFAKKSLIFRKNTDKFKKIFLDVLFPISCLSCRRAGEWICASCFQKIPLRKKQFCPYCKKIITPSGEFCFACSKKSHLDGLLVASYYKIKIIARLIHLFKYRYVENLSVPLGKIMRNAFLKFKLPLPDLIIPVPISKKRLRARGYNQSALLARYLSEHIAPSLKIFVFENILKRTSANAPQMTIKNREKRKLNVKSAFALNNPKDAKIIKNKTILLVDDVSTTGATLFECAKILKRAGAKEVNAIVLAGQEMNDL